MTQGIDIKQDGRVLVVTNDSPATRNALTPEFYLNFRAALGKADKDPGVGAVVLTGAGDFFCSGGNLKGLQARRLLDEAGRRASLDKLHDLIRAMRACAKPIVAAVEGGAAGAGVSLALACDLLVAAAPASFSVAYVKIGLTPDGGATYFLSRALPRQLVTELCMTGQPVTATRLATFGLVNRLVEPGQARDEAVRFAAELARGPGQSLARIKELCSAASGNNLDSQLELEAQFMAKALGSADGAEGIDAFLEKRTANFSK